MFDNYDNLLHSVNCNNRDIYVGATMAVKDILSIEEKVEKELGGRKNALGN